MKVFEGIQILRLFAALLVVVMHAHQAWTKKLGLEEYWAAGSAGVDIFFVISGFVMMYTTTEYGRGYLQRWAEAVGFLKRRIIRIVPLYWIYTSLKLAVLLVLPALASRTTIDLHHLVASYAFFPVISPWGNFEPFLPVGWTLNFEIFFYLIFSLAIFLNVNRVVFCSSIFFLLILISTAYPLGVLTFYSQSIVFEFVLGCLVASNVSFIEKVPFRNIVGAALVVVSVLWIFWVGPELFSDRLLRWGIPSALLVIGVICLESWVDLLPVSMILKRLGDSSYSIYLSHTFVIPFFVILVFKLDLSLIWYMVCSLAASMLVGFFSFLYIEKPVLKYMKKFS